jgi:hypothetical protein
MALARSFFIRFGSICSKEARQWGWDTVTGPTGPLCSQIIYPTLSLMSTLRAWGKAVCPALM